MLSRVQRAILPFFFVMGFLTCASCQTSQTPQGVSTPPSEEGSPTRAGKASATNKSEELAANDLAEAQAAEFNQGSAEGQQVNNGGVGNEPSEENFDNFLEDQSQANGGENQPANVGQTPSLTPPADGSELVPSTDASTPWVEAAPPPGLPLPAESAPVAMASLPRLPSPPIGRAKNDFAGVPHMPGARRLMAQSEAPEEYVVEYGDTLMDVCDQLLGEPGYWPKLWALNPYIKNPHFIWPGMRIRFYPGDEEAPPALDLVREDDLVPVESQAEMPLAEMIIEDITPKLQTYERRQPAEVIGIDQVEELPDRYLTLGEIYSSSKVALTLPGFILREQPSAACHVSTGLLGEVLISEDLPFLCELPEGASEPLALGRTYTVLRYAGEVEDSQEELVIGHRYQFVAHVKLEAKLDEGDRLVGRATKIRLGLTEGDIVVPYVSTWRVVDLAKKRGNASLEGASIVSFDEDGRQIGGQGQMVYINKGKEGGVAEGQVYPIRQNLAHHLTADVDTLPNYTTTVGYVQIIDSTEVGAVGYIVYNTREVFVGDALGKG